MVSSSTSSYLGMQMLTTMKGYNCNDDDYQIKKNKLDSRNSA